MAKNSKDVEKAVSDNVENVAAEPVIVNDSADVAANVSASQSAPLAVAPSADNKPNAFGVTGTPVPKVIHSSGAPIYDENNHVGLSQQLMASANVATKSGDHVSAGVLESLCLKLAEIEHYLAHIGYVAFEDSKKALEHFAAFLKSKI